MKRGSYGCTSISLQGRLRALGMPFVTARMAAMPEFAKCEYKVQSCTYCWACAKHSSICTWALPVLSIFIPTGSVQQRWVESCGRRRASGCALLSSNCCSDAIDVLSM